MCTPPTVYLDPLINVFRDAHSLIQYYYYFLHHFRAPDAL